MTQDRKTFTVPEGYEAIRDSEGRATGEIRPIVPMTGKSKATDGALDEPIILDTEALDAAMDEAGSGWGMHLDRDTKRWLMSKAIGAYLAALPPPMSKSERLAALEWCIGVCDHAVEHYKGPIALKIRREIAVEAARIRSSLAALPPPTGEPVAWQRIVEKIASAIVANSDGTGEQHEMANQIARECIPLFEQLGMTNEGDGWGFED